LNDRSGLPIQGAHVLVGLVDSGIDLSNPDFKNTDGSTRVKYVWDQTGTGKPPAGFGFGAECDSARIDRGACKETDVDGHGTYVAGIAAGNGRSSSAPKEVGVAPQADIIAVKSDLFATHIIAAWEYLVQKAQELHEPIVINRRSSPSMLLSARITTVLTCSRRGWTALPGTMPGFRSTWAPASPEPTVT
jgi:hypothetical protein